MYTSMYIELFAKTLIIMHGKKFVNHQTCIKASINKTHIHILSGITKIKVELLQRPIS